MIKALKKLGIGGMYLNKIMVICIKKNDITKIKLKSYNQDQTKSEKKSFPPKSGMRKGCLLSTLIHYMFEVSFRVLRQ
jgi:hypothetical protein